MVTTKDKPEVVEVITPPIVVLYDPDREKPAKQCPFHVMLPIPDKGVGVSPPIKMITLMPGVNPAIDPADWAVAKQDPQVQQRIKWGAIREIAPTTIKPDMQPDVSLDGFSLEDSEELIQNCYAVTQLELWAQTERRTDLSRKIFERIKEIKEGRAI